MVVLMSLSLIGIIFICQIRLVLADNTLTEQAEDWQISKTQDNITLYTRQIDTSDFSAFKSEAIMELSIESIFAVISDPTSCPLWVDDCLRSSSYTPKNEDTPQFKNRHGYALSHLPWPFKNRDIIVNIVTSNNPITNEIVITMTADKNLVSENKDAVHIKRSQAKYILRPINKNQTKFIWMQHTEPAGGLPAWLVNSMIIDLPLKSTIKLQKVAKQKKYQDALIEFDSQKLIQGLKFRD